MENVLDDVGDVAVVVPNGWDPTDPCTWWMLLLDLKRLFNYGSGVSNKEGKELQRKIQFCQNKFEHCSI